MGGRDHRPAARASTSTRWGIRPRTARGLVGIPLAPFLHSGLSHLIANTIPFAVLGAVVALGGVKRFVEVTVTIVLVSGLGTWLFGTGGTIHIGASGLVFGYLTYLIARGFFAAKPLWILGGIVIGLLYGGMLWGLLPRPGDLLHRAPVRGRRRRAGGIRACTASTPARKSWPMPRDPASARDVWRRLELVHSVSYFAPEAIGALTAARLQGLLDGLLRRPRRAARGRRPRARGRPLLQLRAGPGGPGAARGVVDRRARRRPGGPRRRRPRRPRSGRSATSSRPASPRPPSWPPRAARTAIPDGRALFAANAALPWPTEPLDVLWHAATLLREHRGDGHVALLTASGLVGPRVQRVPVGGRQRAARDDRAGPRLRRRRVAGRGRAPRRPRA